MRWYGLPEGARQRWLRRPSPRFARHVAKIVPVVACIPGSEILSLRYAAAFLAHLAQGGGISDRSRDRDGSDRAGTSFNFDHFRGGPLLWAPGLLASGHLFIGHTICPGFSKVASEYSWWQDTRFCTPGYDYFHDGWNYAHVPVDMAPHAYASVSVSGMEAAAWSERAQRSILLYSDPVAQAVAYYHFCRNHPSRRYSMLGGQRIRDWAFRDFFFQHALPSYARMFLTYQIMADRVPGSVLLLPYERLQEHPAKTLASVFAHLGASRCDLPLIDEAVACARPERLASVNGRLVDRRRLDALNGNLQTEKAFLKKLDPGLRREGLEFLEALGVDAGYFPQSCGMDAVSRTSAA